MNELREVSLQVKNGSRVVDLPLSTAAKPAATSLQQVQKRTIETQQQTLVCLRVAIDSPYAVSFVSCAVTVTIRTGKTLLAKQSVFPEVDPQGKSAVLRVAVSDMGELVGETYFRVELSNANGLFAQFSSVWFTASPPMDENFRRLQTMRGFVAENSEALLHGMQGDLFERDDARELCAALGGQFALVDEVLTLAERLKPFFEQSAKFRITCREEVTEFDRIDCVTERTLSYIATHPEELQVALRGHGLRVRGQWYGIRNALAQKVCRRYDVLENLAIVGFLRTAHELLSRLAHSLRDPDDSEDSGRLIAEPFGEAGLLSQMESKKTRLEWIYRGYRAVFGVPDVRPLAAMPPPTPHFASSVPYRQFYDLMARWFSLQAPDLTYAHGIVAEETGSRLYEYYVLALCLSAMPFERAAHFAYRDQERGRVANTFSVADGELSVTLYYEPVIHTGLVPVENGLGLVRTMTFDFSESGRPENNLDKARWTPDFVLKVSSSGRSCFWIADAKWSTWPSVMKNYAADVVFKYLCATGCATPSDHIEGLTLFCGKSYRQTEMQRNMRNTDILADRAERLETLTLDGQSVDRDAALVKAWLERALARSRLCLGASC